LLAKLSRQLICAAQFRDADSGAFFASIALLTFLADSEHLAIWPLSIFDALLIKFKRARLI